MQRLQSGDAQRNKLLQLVPDLSKSKTVLDAMANQEPCREGDFWQACHILDVRDGGGGCDVTNMRTLCVLCHRAETRAKNAMTREDRVEWARRHLSSASAITGGVGGPEPGPGSEPGGTAARGPGPKPCGPGLLHRDAHLSKRNTGSSLTAASLPKRQRVDPGSESESGAGLTSNSQLGLPAPRQSESASPGRAGAHRKRQPQSAFTSWATRKEAAPSDAAAKPGAQ